MDNDDSEPARQRGDRFKDSDDALEQLEQIEEAQRKLRKKKLKDRIQSIEKSKARLKNRLKEIRTSEDLGGERGSRMSTQQDIDSVNRLIEEENLEQALVKLQMLEQNGDHSAIVFAKLGEVYWELENLASAIPAFRRATELMPNSESLSLSLFHCLWEDGQQVEALGEAKRFTAIAPSDDYRQIVEEINAKA